MGNEITFKETVQATNDIKNGFCLGLQALGANAKFITTTNPRMLDGSVDIDECTKKIYPNDARWDYVIGYDGKAYFIEIHPANTSNVKEVIKKAAWLNNWLKTRALELKALSANNNYYWIASGKHNILQNSPQHRQLSQSKVKLINNCKLPLI